MELVVLNIGYDLGVLKPEIFAMMVIMALVTTIMTGPALDIINWSFKQREVAKTKKAGISRFNILISFGNPLSGRSLLRLAQAFLPAKADKSHLTALHLSLSNELHSFNIEEYERESFAPILRESKKLKRPFTQLYKASFDIDADMAETANQGEFDFLLVGLGQSIFEGSLLGKLLGFTSGIINPDRLYGMVTGREKLFENSPFDERTKQIIFRSKPAVGILIDKDLQQVQKVVVPFFHPKDEFLQRFVRKLARTGTEIILIDVGGSAADGALQAVFRKLVDTFPNNVRLQASPEIDTEVVAHQDLMMLSLESWKRVVDAQSIWLHQAPSTLIVRG
jgi:hypothetical protein